VRVPEVLGPGWPQSGPRSHNRLPTKDEPAAPSYIDAEATVSNEWPYFDQDVIAVAKHEAKENGVSVARVATTTTSEAIGAPAVEIKVVIMPGSSASIMGLKSTLSTSQIVRQLADRGEERFPFVRYEEASADRL
jgi:hypothetical protein